MPYLTSLGIQAFAKHSAFCAVQPALVLEYLMKSDVLNCQHSLSEMMSTSLTQKAALWQFYGHSELCMLNAQMTLSLNSQEAGGVYCNSDAESVSLCHMARLHADQGLYDAAFDILKSASERFPTACRDSSLWMACDQRIRFTMALHRGRLSAAELAISNLASVNKLEATYWSARHVSSIIQCLPCTV